MFRKRLLPLVSISALLAMVALYASGALASSVGGGVTLCAGAKGGELRYSSDGTCGSKENKIVAAANGDAQALEGTVAALQQQAAQQSAQIAGLQQQLAQTEARLTGAIQDGDAALQAQLQSMKAEVQQQAQEIQALDATNASQSQQIQSLGAANTQQNTLIATLGGKVGDLEGQVAQLDARVDALEAAQP